MFCFSSVGFEHEAIHDMVKIRDATDNRISG